MYNEAKVRSGVEAILEGLGLDPLDANFEGTPARVARAYRELCRGLYDRDGDLVATFPCSYEGMVIARDIEAVSLCPHHLLPIRYVVHVGYIPSGEALGLSKLPRLVQWLSARPVLQEDLTDDIADTVERAVKAGGVIVVVKGKHACVWCRGVRSGAEFVTSAIRGGFMDGPRGEFLALVNGSRL